MCIDICLIRKKIEYELNKRMSYIVSLDMIGFLLVLCDSHILEKVIVLAGPGMADWLLSCVNLLDDLKVYWLGLTYASEAILCKAQVNELVIVLFGPDKIVVMDFLGDPLVWNDFCLV